MGPYSHGPAQQIQQLGGRITFRGRPVFRRSQRNPWLGIKRATRFPHGAQGEAKEEKVDMAGAAFAVTQKSARQELQEVMVMFTQAQRIITASPQDAKELLDHKVKQARALVVKFRGVSRPEYEDAIFHQAWTPPPSRWRYCRS